MKIQDRIKEMERQLERAYFINGIDRKIEDFKREPTTPIDLVEYHEDLVARIERWGGDTIWREPESHVRCRWLEAYKQCK